jgi:ATP-dependent Lon protease
VLRLGAQIQNQVSETFSKNQREFFLREQLKAIRKELGETDPQQIEPKELEEKLAKAGLPPEVEKVAKRERERLGNIPVASPEYAVARTYLEILADLPWNVRTVDNLDIARARRILDEDHYDLKKVKDRILEYLSVLKLKQDLKGPILCFLGPPGVGKTSLGQSIARALGRKFIRMSLGGVRDEAEIRGHRRTYIGSMPGRVIQNLRKAGTRNPVFMLDEIDKLGTDFRGDPASALLEVLDPAQNNTFTDHYLDVPFDLSSVLFIATANMARSHAARPARPHGDHRAARLHPAGQAQHRAPPPDPAPAGRPRPEAGPGRAQRRHAGGADRRLHPRGRGAQPGPPAGQPVPQGRPPRGRGPPRAADHRPRALPGLLGPRIFDNEVAEKNTTPGVVTGLAWTPTGGDILFIEATRMPGKGSLILTGSLGDVMKESAMAALSLVRAQAARWKLDVDFEKTDFHVHVPAGAVPKDGPSAGVAMLVALYSLVTGRALPPDTALTGEITLRGKVMPVGGIKEKVLAASRAGITRILLPADNRRHLTEVPPGRFQVEMLLDWNMDPPGARYTLRDGFGATLSHLSLSWPEGGPADYRYFTGTPLQAAPLPNLAEPIEGTDLAWMDLSLAFLWWPDGVTRGTEEVKGRECYVLDIPAPAGDFAGCSGVRVWIDPRISILLRAEAYGMEDQKLRRLEVKSFRKINDRWFIKDIEVQSYPSRHKTILRVRDVQDRERKQFLDQESEAADAPEEVEPVTPVPDATIPESVPGT